jgi:hypothetical protein
MDVSENMHCVMRTGMDSDMGGCRAQTSPAIVTPTLTSSPRTTISTIPRRRLSQISCTLGPTSTGEIYLFSFVQLLLDSHILCCVARILTRCWLPSASCIQWGVCWLARTGGP